MTNKTLDVEEFVFPPPEEAVRVANELNESERDFLIYAETPEYKAIEQAKQLEIDSKEKVMREAIMDAHTYERNSYLKVENESYLKKDLEFLSSYQIAQNEKVDASDFQDKWKSIVECVANENLNVPLFDRRLITTVAQECLDGAKPKP